MAVAKRKYKVITKANDPMDTVVEVAGLTAQFTLRELEAGINKSTQKVGELKEVEKNASTKMTELEQVYPALLKMDDKLRTAVWLLSKANTTIKQCDEAIKEAEQIILQQKSQKELAMAQKSNLLHFHPQAVEFNAEMSSLIYKYEGNRDIFNKCVEQIKQHLEAIENDKKTVKDAIEGTGTELLVKAESVIPAKKK